MWVVIIVSIGVLLAALLFVGKSMQREAESWQWVVHTREVLERLQSVLTQTSEAESAQRGFLLSGDAHNSSGSTARLSMQFLQT